jgi:hypothetical protein
VLFPGGRESPTFPQVRLGCPSLWSASSSISALAGRVSGAGLCWIFQFPFRRGGDRFDSGQRAIRRARIRRTPARVHGLGRLFFPMVFELAARRSCFDCVFPPMRHRPRSKGQRAPRRRRRRRRFDPVRHRHQRGFHEVYDAFSLSPVNESCSGWCCGRSARPSPVEFANGVPLPGFGRCLDPGELAINTKCICLGLDGRDDLANG